MASIEAVDRRRQSRKQRAARRQEIEREVSRRMLVRFYGGQTPSLILLDYRYWQARRCGWNPLNPELRQTGVKREGRAVLYEPQASPLWLWWGRLHYTQREAIVALSKYRLRRPASN